MTLRLSTFAAGAALALTLAAPLAAQNSFTQPQTGNGFGQAQTGSGFGQVQPGFQGQGPGIALGQATGPGVVEPPRTNGMPEYLADLQGQQPPVSVPPAGQLDPQLLGFLQQLAQYERQEMGVPPSPQLHGGAMHGPTPTAIPGGQVITTLELVQLIQGQQTPYLLFDALGGGETLPGAIPAAQASAPGQPGDQISQQMGQYLQQATRGNTQVPMIFYCASRECWMSYNAALRAIQLGYSRVYWYRGGLDAWKQAGGPTVQSGYPGTPQPPATPMPPQPQNGLPPQASYGQPGQMAQPGQSSGWRIGG